MPRASSDGKYSVYLEIRRAEICGRCNYAYAVCQSTVKVPRKDFTNVRCEFKCRLVALLFGLNA